MFDNYIAKQLRRPTGLVGWWVGRRMVEQHQPENVWTVNLLDVQPTDRILEIGFGPGYAVEQVADQITSGMVGGVDFSRAMVRLAKRRNKKAVRAGKVDLRYGEANHIPFEDATFDKVYSINCVYFWMQPLTALEEIRRVMKPGGRVIVTLLPKERWDTAAYGEPTETPMFNPYSSDELCDLLAQAGFTDVRVEAGDKPVKHSVIGQK